MQCNNAQVLPPANHQPVSSIPVTTGVALNNGTASLVAQSMPQPNRTTFPGNNSVPLSNISNTCPTPTVPGTVVTAPYDQGNNRAAEVRNGIDFETTTGNTINNMMHQSSMMPQQQAYHNNSVNNVDSLPSSIEHRGMSQLGFNNSTLNLSQTSTLSNISQQETQLIEDVDMKFDTG